MQKMPTPSRRYFLVGTAGIIAAPIVLKASRAAAKSDSITMVNYGGSYQDATVKAILDPFTKETGIKVEVVPYSGLDKVKAMQLTGNVEIDIYMSTGAEAAGGSKRGFWDKLDPSLFDLKDLKIQPATDYATTEIYSRGIAWDPKKFGPGKHPTTFAEFFDLQKFPGRRTVRARGQDTLEMALLADGVAPKDIYPLDLNRAFKALDRIKSQIVWAATTPQDTSLLQVGEADFSIANVNRVKSTTEPGGGVPLAYSFEQNLNGGQTLQVLKGARNKENAMKLIAYCLRPEVQANFFNLVGTTPVSKKASAMLSPEVSKWQPDLDNPKSVYINNTYWAENYEAVTRRFQEWRLT
ncbi:ABC transporter substrate-binding protein [Bradyrhizobium brasilense]|uniref:ABC transporter substrate-binding protein n=1 Tax=Bradyrhizobium brasilense TaxID=1419277 RepID=UPI001E5DE0C8|nr:ABC transporter substrate-binding protein [Bradyrhizobium brasilense]MCC8969162.1 ABC transporter substrate-binding protein [Bradyrhizobium brasilense]